MAKIIPGKNGSKKEVIIHKAATLFRKKGFAATSMRDIAASIGVEAPSLYNHIESKNAILKEVCFRVAQLFMNNLKGVELSPELRPMLKAAGVLKRDPRSVERKKFGHKKARRSFQFSKR